MSRTSRLAGAALAAVGSVVVLAAPASAWAGGAVAATASGAVSVGPITCTGSTLTGNITPAGAVTITAGAFTGCSPGTVILHPPSTGSLVSGASSLGLRLTINLGGISCTYAGVVTGTHSPPPPPITVTYAGTLTKTAGSFLCPATLAFSATYLYTGPGL